MWSQLLVFVSSTSDLRSERAAIAAALPSGFTAYLYETDRARASSPEAHLERIISESEVFTCVLGATYGSIYPGCEDRSSIVEWEFDTARQRDDIAIMTYVKRVPDAEIDAEQRQFRERVTAFREGVWRREFDTTGALVDLVKDDLLTWLAEFYRELRAREAGTSLQPLPTEGVVSERDAVSGSRPPDTLRLHRTLLMITVAVAATVPVAALVLARKRAVADGDVLVAGAGALAAVAIIGCLILTKLFLGGDLRDVGST